MSEVKQLFTCVVCGRSWTSKQSLRAHMKVHKGEYARTTYYVPTELRDRFNEVCKAHKTTTCHVLSTLLAGIVEGAERGDIDLPRILSSNPLVINISHVFLGKPRSKYKMDVGALPALGKACHVCGSRMVKERQLELEPLIQGTCLECGSEWLIHQGKDVKLMGGEGWDE